MIKNKVRQELSAIEAYTPCRLKPKGIFLNANETPWDTRLNRYPQPADKLNTRLAQYYGVEIPELLLTRGSDEGIDLLIHLFCQPYKDEIIICPPTFSMYAVSAQVRATNVLRVPLKEDFSLDVPAIEQRITSNTKIIFICSPNNPTGNVMAKEDILLLANLMADQGVVVIDEAYIEFASVGSLVQQIKQYPNIVVLRTLSKALGLAALRCGIILAQKELITLLKNIMPPYPFSSLTLEAAAKGTTSVALTLCQDRIAYINQEKQWLMAQLQMCSSVKKIWFSEANYLLVKIANAKNFIAYAENAGVYIRDVGNMDALPDCVRITIGLKWQNKKLLQIVKAWGNNATA